MCLKSDSGPTGHREGVSNAKEKRIPRGMNAAYCFNTYMEWPPLQAPTAPYISSIYPVQAIPRV